MVCKVDAVEMPDKTRALMENRGKNVGLSIEWEVGNEALTEAEMSALRVKHKTRNVNYTRAASVKQLMEQGRKCVEIVCLLRRQYGERMIKADHAALSGRGGTKKR